MMNDKKKGKRVIGLVQCDFAKERCSGFGCMNSFANRNDYFAGYEDNVILVPFNCGGCPGRRIPRIAENLIKRAKKKADIRESEIIIHLASCMVTDNGHYPPCPHLDYIKKMLKRKSLPFAEGSYIGKTAAKRRGQGMYEEHKPED